MPKASVPETPSTLTLLILEKEPDTIVTLPLGTRNRFARNAMRALLALPSTAGAVSFTLRVLPSEATTLFVEEPGTTRMVSTVSCFSP